MLGHEAFLDEGTGVKHMGGRMRLIGRRLERLARVSVLVMKGPVGR